VKRLPMNWQRIRQYHCIKSSRCTKTFKTFSILFSRRNSRKKFRPNFRQSRKPADIREPSTIRQLRRQPISGAPPAATVKPNVETTRPPSGADYFTPRPAPAMGKRGVRRSRSLCRDACGGNWPRLKRRSVDSGPCDSRKRRLRP